MFIDIVVFFLDFFSYILVFLVEFDISSEWNGNNKFFVVIFFYFNKEW